MRSRRISLILAFCSVWAWSPCSAEGLRELRGAPQPEDLLERALANRHDVDLAQRIKIILRNDRGAERRYVVEMATKRIDGQLRSFARFTHPESDSGTAILMIEQRGRHDDTFVYFPYAKRVRRVSSAQRADRFMGTDLTYEDFERRYAEDYEVIDSSDSHVEGERVSRVRVRPRFAAGYHGAEFAIAVTDYAILEMQYFRDPSPDAFRIVSAPRAYMIERGGHVLPGKVLIRNLDRRTTTEVKFEETEVDPPLADSLFTEVSLQIRKPILAKHRPESAGRE